MAGIILFILCAAVSSSPLSLFSAVFIHEAGHLLCAALLHMGHPRLKINAVGLRVLYGTPAYGARRAALCLSGPLAGAVLAAVFFRFRFFFLYSMGFSLINLIPVSCFDGGGAFAALCDAVFLPDISVRIQKTVSVISVILLWALSVLVQLRAGANLSLMVLCCAAVVAILTDRA